LADEDTEIRRYAAWALGKIEYLEAEQALIGTLNDSSSEVRRNAAGAIRSFGTPGGISVLDERIDRLLVALHDRDWNRRHAAAQLLDELGGERAENALRDYRRMFPDR
ncbi:MAG: HEAT repeat domain-containing protein, partial [Bdellovibrionales bacterium]|nr:HEAT repeat domain-containing protein [Bdellovibrionales bacterium]